MNRRSRSLSLDRNSPRNRRMSPLGRRASPVRRMSPLGRRASPVRRMSPRGRRASPVDNFSDFESPVSYNDPMRSNHRELTPFFGSDDEVVENLLESSPERSNNKINRNRHALFSKLSKHRHRRML